MTESLAQVGNYKLGELIGSYPEAKEYSWLEKRFVINSVPGETLYKVPARVEVLGTQWVLVLGVYQGRIFKLSLRWGVDDWAAMTAKLYEVVEYCSAQYGSNANRTYGDAAVWATDFGNAAVTGRFTQSTLRSEGGFWFNLVMIESFAPAHAPPQAG